MELRVLRYFLMVAQEENITRAAALLHLTQPTLSRQMMQLEDELGVQLFQRSRHSMQLTEEGFRFKQRAQEIVALADKTLAEFSHHEEALSGEIAIGCGETQSMSFLSEKMRRFRALYPQVRFQIHSATAGDIKDKIEQGLWDLGLLTEPVEVAKYEFIRMPARERWGVLVPKTSPLAEQSYVTAKDLTGVPLLLPGRETVQHELSAWFGTYADDLEIAATYSLIVNAANMVRHHVGVALCFEMDFQYETLTFVPLTPVLETGAVVVWKKNQLFQPATQQFMAFLNHRDEAFLEM